MKMLFLVGLGGALGSIARFLSQKAVSWMFSLTFPLGTFLVNILGCLLIGIFFGWSEKNNFLNPEIRLFLTTGFCGGFTTFSTFTLDSIMLLRDAQYFYLGLYVVLSVILGMAATFAGIMLVKII